MIDDLVSLAALGAAMAVYVGWPAETLSRLEPLPGITWPAWIRPKPAALPARTRGIAASGALVVGMLTISDPLPLSLGLGAVLAGVVFWGLGRIEIGEAAAKRAELVADLPTALDVLAACVASGMPLRTATSAVATAVGGSLGERLESVVARTAAGFGDGDAWAVLGDDPVLGSVAKDLARAADSGTAIGALLARHAEAARSQAHTSALTRAKAVGVQTIIPVSVCYLPAFFLLGVVPVIAGVLASLVG